MNNKAAWNMLKRKLIGVLLPTVGVLLLIRLTTP